MNPTESQFQSIGQPNSNSQSRDFIAATNGGFDGLLMDVTALTKARANVAVVVTAFVGFALHTDITGNLAILLHTLAGTALLAAGSAIANQAREFKFDQLMDRTRHRPIAAGRLHPQTAFWISGALSFGGCFWLGRFVNLAAMSLAGLAFIIYVFAYTPMKRLGPACIPVGAVSGALPVLVGWAAAGRGLGIWGVTAFAVLFLWQFPHFLAVAWWHQRDYSRAGYRILPTRGDRGSLASQWALVFTVATITVSMMHAVAPRATNAYRVGGLLAGIPFLIAAVRFAAKKCEASARILFLASLYYLPVIFALMLLCQP